MDNTVRRAQSTSKVWGVLLIVALWCGTLVCSSMPVAAESGGWTPTQMRAQLPPGTPDPGYLLLTPTWETSGSLYLYSYRLENLTAADHVVAFGLSFNDVTGTPDFSNYIVPDQWKLLVYSFPATPNYVELVWRSEAELADLLPGGYKEFGFSSYMAPDVNETEVVLASAQNEYGYGGPTRGPLQSFESGHPPVIPESSAMLLAATGAGSLGLVRLRVARRRR